MREDCSDPTIAAAIAVAVATFTLAAPAMAQDSGAPTAAPDTSAAPHDADKNQNTVTIGAGAGYVPSYEGSNDYVIVPVGAVRGQLGGVRFFSSGASLYVDLVDNKPGPSWDFQLGPVVAANFNRYGRIIDPRVRALGKRGIAVEAGGFVGLAKTGVITSDYDTLGARVSYVHDVTSVNKSYIITPEISYSTPLSKSFYVGVSASADYVGGGYARAYFDVDPAGSLRSGLPVFSGSRGWKDITYSGLMGLSLSGDLRHGLALFATGSYSRLYDRFADSPVVSIAGDRNQFFGAVGIGYTF